MCREAGYKGPLNRCSIYGDKQVGEKLKKMLEMGQSRPWPEALKALTGEEKMDATAILDYFAPLKTWMDEQNKALAKWRRERESEGARERGSERAGDNIAVIESRCLPLSRSLALPLSLTPESDPASSPPSYSLRALSCPT